MKVKDLIRHLELFPDDYEVIIPEGGWDYYPISSLEERDYDADYARAYLTPEFVKSGWGERLGYGAELDTAPDLDRTVKAVVLWI